jgi:hypothetical protein
MYAYTKGSSTEDARIAVDGALPPDTAVDLIK